MTAALRLAFAPVILAIIAFGFYLTGSPAENRILRQDELRVQDLAELRRAIGRYHRKEEKAPTSLEPIVQNCQGNSDYRCTRLQGVVVDDYEYIVISEARFRLCTTFERAAPFPINKQRKASNPSDHEAGRQCYDYSFR